MASGANYLGQTCSIYYSKHVTMVAFVTSLLSLQSVQTEAYFDYRKLGYFFFSLINGKQSGKYKAR